MRKFISFAIFALLATTMTFSLNACSNDDEKDGGLPDLSEFPDVPQTVEQAKQMLMGQWQYAGKEVLLYEDEAFIEHAANGHRYYFLKVKADASDGKWYSGYKGQYLGYIQWEHYKFEPNPEDPTKGVIFKWIGDESNPKAIAGENYSNLTKNSMNVNDYSMIRPTKTIKYTIIPNPNN